MFVNDYGDTISNQELLEHVCENAVNYDIIQQQGLELLSHYVPHISEQNDTNSHLVVLYTALTNSSYWTHVYIANGQLFLTIAEEFKEELDIDIILNLIQDPSSITVPDEYNEMVNPVSPNDFIAAILFTCTSLLYIAGVAEQDVKFEWITSEYWMELLTGNLELYHPTPSRVFSISISRKT
ncbi:hypothetical protein LCGC14_0195020 [marine sediment metagenome]|uniref:Uncharacterized protein n=1 Tax=marine sediment metagenome TaxID=412755 RepID=A0A0F9UPU9_9ZZZZ